MRFKEFILKNEIPSILFELIKDKKVRAINKAHRSGDLVYNIGNEYILKISTSFDRLDRERKANDLLKDYLPVSKSIAFISDNKYTYYLKTRLKGVPLTEKLQDPLLLIKYLKEAIIIFHNVDITKLVNILPNNGTTLIHGDFCLPNILVHNNKISGFIDVEAVSIDDPWVDYSWAIWSLEYNLGTNEYTPLLLKELNIDFNQEKYDKYTKM